MNARVLFALKGAGITTLGVALVCGVCYGVSWFAPHVMPRSFVASLFSTLIPFGVFVGALGAWVTFPLPKQERWELTKVCAAIVGVQIVAFMLVRWLWGLFIGPGKDEASRFVQQMAVQLIFFGAVLIWKKVRARS